MSRLARFRRQGVSGCGTRQQKLAGDPLFIDRAFDGAENFREFCASSMVMGSPRLINPSGSDFAASSLAKSSKPTYRAHNKMA
jgi:hypothetical protein